jgi:hypothetical protein
MAGEKLIIGAAIKYGVPAAEAAAEAAVKIIGEALPTAAKSTLSAGSKGLLGSGHAEVATALSHPIAAPTLIGERMGTMVTPARIEKFGADLVTRTRGLQTDYELRDRLEDAGTNCSKKRAAAERALERAGFIIDDWQIPSSKNIVSTLLKEFPAARRAVSTYHSAADSYRDIFREYDRKAVAPRFVATYQATRGLVEDSGMFMPKMKYSRNLPGAHASYLDGRTTLSEDTLTGNWRSLGTSTVHELTHFEQNILQIGWKADSLNIGQKASQAQMQDISAWFSEMNCPTSVATIEKALAVRSGRFLTDEAAQRAEQTIKGVGKVLEIQSHQQPLFERANQLERFMARSTYGGELKNVILELGSPESGPALNLRLFGQERGPALYAQYAGRAEQAQSFAKLPRSLKDDFSMAVYHDINDGMKDVASLLEPYTAAYNSAPHEIEAAINGELADNAVVKAFLSLR